MKQKFWVIQQGFHHGFDTMFFNGTLEQVQAKRSELAVMYQAVTIFRKRANSESSKLRAKTCPNHPNYYKEPAWPPNRNRKSFYHCTCGCMK